MEGFLACTREGCLATSLGILVFEFEDLRFSASMGLSAYLFIITI